MDIVINGLNELAKIYSMQKNDFKLCMPENNETKDLKFTKGESTLFNAGY